MRPALTTVIAGTGAAGSEAGGSAACGTNRAPNPSLGGADRRPAPVRDERKPRRVGGDGAELPFAGMPARVEGTPARAPDQRP
ncbi:hypothetical protein Ate01nite_24140 [Actinoplanes teichomyceticus]|nr:hypothetical protein Ate01nite_24140 [Actinoplanes teichomyceticus]